MPDYGLTEALASALKATKDAKFARAPEMAAAARAGEPIAPAAVPTDAAPAPRIDPDMPTFQPPTPGAVDPANVAPTPPGGPPPVDPVAPSLDDSAPPPGVQPPKPTVPTALPGDAAPGQTPAEAAGAPQKPVAADVPPVDTQAVQTDAQRFVTANVGDFAGKLNLSHMPNVDTISAPQGMKAAILQVADDNASAIDQARRGEIGNEQLLGLAQDIAVNTDVVKTVLQRELGTQFEKPEVLLAARLVGVNVLGEAQIAAGPIVSGKATSADIIEYARRKELFVKYQTQLQGGMAEQGRGLNAASIPAAGTLPPGVMDHIAAIIRQNNPNLEAEANSIKLATTPVGIANILSGSLPMRIGKAAYSAVQRIFINGILSGPPTWAKIFTGNTFNLAVNTADIFNAGLMRGMTTLAQRLGRYPTSAEGAQMSDAFTYAHGVISGGADALRLANRTLRTGVSLDNVLRFDPSDVSGLKNVNPALGTTQSIVPELTGTWFGAIAKGIDTVIDAPGSRAIGSIDEFAKTLGARGYRTMMTMREISSQMKDGTLKPGDAGVIAKQMFENPSPEMLQAEEDWAHRQTFQTPFPEGGPGEAFSSFIANKLPALKFVFPFMRTSVNIFKQSVVERTPLAALSSRLRSQLAAGGIEGDIARGRIASGTAIGGMLSWMAIHDQITGDAPKDPKERALWEQDGRTPYSMKITDPVTGVTNWKSYAWMEPTASIAGIVADSASAFARIHQDEELDSLKDKTDMYSDMIAHVMGAIITNTANKTFMTGAAKFSEMFADPEHGFKNWAQDVGTSLVPYSKAIEFARNMKDPYLREAWTLHDKIMNDIPGQSEKLGVAVDLFGEPRKGGGPMGKMSPFPSSPVGSDDVTEELSALMDHTHTVPITMPSKQVAMGGGASGRGILGGSGMPLTSMEYSEMVQKGRAEKNFDGGALNLHDKLSQVMQSPTYMSSTPAERSAMVSLYATQADKFGRDRLFTENQDFRERMIAWNTEKNSLKTGQQ